MSDPIMGIAKVIQDRDAAIARAEAAERSVKELEEQLAQGGPIDSERMTLDDLMNILEQWRTVASGQTCVSFANLCYGATSLWHQTHMDNFRKINKKPKSLSEWVLRHRGSVMRDFPAQVLQILSEQESQLAAAQERVRAMQWRPIAEYDAMAENPKCCVFRFPRVKHKRSPDYDLPELIETTKYMGCRYPDLFLQLPPVPEGE